MFVHFQSYRLGTEQKKQSRPQIRKVAFLFKPCTGFFSTQIGMVCTLITTQDLFFLEEMLFRISFAIECPILLLYRRFGKS